MFGSVIFQKHSQPEPPSILAASYIDLSIFCNAEINISICTPEYQSIVTIFSKRSDIGSASAPGNDDSSIAVIACVSIDVRLPAPSWLSIPSIGPLTIITGRKNISLKNPLPFTFWLSIIAIISANTTIIGTEIIVETR